MAWFIAAVGGCCGLADSAAAVDPAVLGSAALIAAVGGCCPAAEPAAPTVGPAPASRVAKSLLVVSISVVHCPARAAPVSKADTAHATRKVVDLDPGVMALSPIQTKDIPAHAQDVVIVDINGSNK